MQNATTSGKDDRGGLDPAVAAGTPRLCLVTGATGFIGSRLVERLVALGHRVRIACRETSDCRWLAAVTGKYQRFVADLGDRSALERAVAGCQWVFHVGGLTTAPDWATYERINQEGTANVFAAATTTAADTLERFVYVSSLSAGGPAANRAEPKTESAPPTPVSMYGRSKRGGEVRIRELAESDRRREWPWVVVRPSVVYGPRDTEVLEFFRLLKRGIRPTLGLPSLWLSIIHVDDLVDAVLAVALSDPALVSQQTFNACNPDYLAFPEVMREIQRQVGRRVVLPLRVPLWALFAQARVMAVLGRLFRFLPDLTVDKCRELAGRYWMADTTRIRECTGWSPRIQLAAGFRQTAEWYRNENWL